MKLAKASRTAACWLLEKLDQAGPTANLVIVARSKAAVIGGVKRLSRSRDTQTPGLLDRWHQLLIIGLDMHDGRARRFKPAKGLG